MSEWSAHWTTDAATPEGHQQASYSQLDNSRVQKIIAGCNNFEGVALGYQFYALAGTVTGPNTVAINTGSALVDGKAYINDASLNVNIPSSGGGKTRIDRIVLRADWAAFTVTVTRIAGTESAGTPTAPAITQTPGTTYDIMLYQALVNSSGTVTLTDERVMAAPLVAYRQGGSATVWSTSGTTNYVPGKQIIQAGCILTAISPAAHVTFPVPFAYKPLVYPGITYETQTNVKIYNLTVNGFDVMTYYSVDNQPFGDEFNWLAIGPVA